MRRPIAKSLPFSISACNLLITDLDIAKHRDAERTGYIILNWLRNRNTIECLGIWKQLNTPGLKPIEFDGFRKQAGEVQDKGIAIVSRAEQDYISFTDIAKYRNNDAPADIVKNWLRSRSTIEFLGLWEQPNNPGFKLVEFDQFIDPM